MRAEEKTLLIQRDRSNRSLAMFNIVLHRTMPSDVDLQHGDERDGCPTVLVGAVGPRTPMRDRFLAIKMAR